MKVLRFILATFAGFTWIVFGVHLIPQVLEKTTIPFLNFLLCIGVASGAILIALVGMGDSND